MHACESSDSQLSTCEEATMSTQHAVASRRLLSLSHLGRIILAGGRHAVGLRLEGLRRAVAEVVRGAIRSRAIRARRDEHVFEVLRTSQPRHDGVNRRQRVVAREGAEQDQAVEADRVGQQLKAPAAQAVLELAILLARLSSQ
jgi:hypothetical protein